MHHLLGIVKESAEIMIVQVSEFCKVAELRRDGAIELIRVERPGQ